MNVDEEVIPDYKNNKNSQISSIQKESNDENKQEEGNG